jgi:hypothetical protein
MWCGATPWFARKKCKCRGGVRIQATVIYMKYYTAADGAGRYFRSDAIFVWRGLCKVDGSMLRCVPQPGWRVISGSKKYEQFLGHRVAVFSLGCIAAGRHPDSAWIFDGRSL